MSFLSKNELLFKAILKMSAISSTFFSINFSKSTLIKMRLRIVRSSYDKEWSILHRRRINTIKYSNSSIEEDSSSSTK